MKNPWPGLASYTEESEYQFNGRSAASATLSALIQRNLFVTLYGRSGIGKTSLLQAGVYPLLRGEGLSPVTIRLNDVQDEKKEEKNQETKDNPKEKEQAEAAPAAQILWEKLLAELSKSGVQYLPCDGKDTYSPVFTDVMVLRSLFSAGRFLKKVDKEDKKEDEGVTPVIVLDQFEELLYQDPAAARLLVSQLYALIDDNYNLTIPHPTWHEDTIFRIVVSIREDDLFLFEDCIDSLNCVDFKSNRYRLMPLSEEEAKEVILTPKSGMFDADEEREIVDKIISISRNKGDSINTLMLSLLCHVLYDKYSAKREPVKIASLSDYDDIIKIYYQNILKEKLLPKKEIYWLEDNLIDEQGRRKAVYISDLQKYAPETYKSEKSESNKENDKNTNNRLLNISQGRVEFIHDQLAASVFKLRTSRKSKKFKQWGIGILITALTVLLLVSLSIFQEGAKEEFSNEKGSLHNNTKVEKYVISEDDSIPQYATYVISDCPNLKTIDIKKRCGSLYIHSCPNLVNISRPKDFKGDIFAYNCINLVEDSIISKFSLNDDVSEDLPGIEYNNKTTRACKYDSVNRLFDIFTLPSRFGDVGHRGVNINGEIKYFTYLPDSIKRLTTCRVPYGYRKTFSQLYEFQPFQKIEELPVYYTWLYYIKGSLSFLKKHKGFLYLSVCIIIVILLFFFFVGLCKKRMCNPLIRLIFAIIYSIGVSLVAILSFMAFYWLVYNIIKPYNQNISIFIGSLGTLICMVLIYRGTIFYALVKSYRLAISRVKSIGLYRVLTELPKRIGNSINKEFKHIKEHFVKFVLIVVPSVILACVGVLLWGFYEQGKQKRIHYLEELSHVHFAKRPVIIEALEEQHGSILYPFFTDHLNKLKQQIYGNETSVVRITPKYIYDIARWNGIDLSATNFYIQAISNDGNGLIIKVKNEYSDMEQMVYYNFLRDMFNTITPKGEKYVDYTSVFSPSGKNLICYSGNQGSIYNVDTRVLNKLSEKFPYDKKIIMTNDNDYYYLDDDALYKGSLNSNATPSEVRDFKPMSLDYIHHIDSGNIVAGNSNYPKHSFIVYSLKQDSIIYRSKEHEAYIVNGNDIRGINSEYVVSSKGVFDLKQDSLIIDSYNDMYMWNSRPVEIRKEDYQFVLYDIKGKHIKTILKANDDKSYGIWFGNNYLYTNDGSSIFIYNLGTKLNRNVKITDYDKKVFDLE